MGQSVQSSQTLRIKLPSSVPPADAPPPVATPSDAPRKIPKVTALPREPVQNRLAPSEFTLYQEFMQSIYDAVLVADWDGRIVDGNSRALEFLRHDANALRTLTLADVIYGFDDAILRQIRANLDRNQFTLIEEAYCQRKDQSLFAAEIATNRLHLGREQHLCLFIRDITRRKQDELLLSQTRDQLARAERLEMAGRIAGHIAHDFNNLLTPLLAYPDFIRDALPTGSPAREDLDVIAATAQQIADINQQLLALSRRAYYEQTLLNLNTLIETETARLVRNDRAKPVALRLDLAPDLAFIQGSSQQLLRVIQNLCQNAVEAMDADGVLTIRTFNTAVSDPVKKDDLMPVGDYVAVSIADTGHGIPPDIQDKIFDPFFTTKKADKQRGSGLGLSVVRGIVKDHHGFIDLASAVGHGATFTLFFPASQECPPAALPAPQTGGTERILIVDDDALQIEVMGRLLRRAGYTVDTARSGEEALAWFAARRQDGRFPDLVILDMVMGSGMDGARTFQDMKAIHPAQKAIIVSGYAESPRVKLAQDLGAGAYLRKPVNLEKLCRAVRQELDKS